LLLCVCVCGACGVTGTIVFRLHLVFTFHVGQLYFLVSCTVLTLSVIYFTGNRMHTIWSNLKSSGRREAFVRRSIMMAFNFQDETNTLNFWRVYLDPPRHTRLSLLQIRHLPRISTGRFSNMPKYKVYGSQENQTRYFFGIWELQESHVILDFETLRE
jgi:hypothetical protein